MYLDDDPGVTPISSKHGSQSGTSKKSLLVQLTVQLGSLNGVKPPPSTSQYHRPCLSQNVIFGSRDVRVEIGNEHNTRTRSINGRVRIIYSLNYMYQKILERSGLYETIIGPIQIKVRGWSTSLFLITCHLVTDH